MTKFPADLRKRDALKALGTVRECRGRALRDRLLAEPSSGTRLRGTCTAIRVAEERPSGASRSTRSAVSEQNLERLGFQVVREREHIAMVRDNPDGTRTPLTMPNHGRVKGSTMRTILTQAGISREEFLRALSEV